MSAPWRCSTSVTRPLRSRLEDQSGKTVKLSDFKGKRVVLYFYPKDDTPGCTQEACNFRDEHSAAPEAGRGGARRQPRFRRSHAKFADKYGLPFPLLADTDHSVAEKYGAWGEKSLYGRKFMGIIRSTFLIDGSGKVARVWPKVKVDGHVDRCSRQSGRSEPSVPGNPGPRFWRHRKVVAVPRGSVLTDPRVLLLCWASRATGSLPGGRDLTMPTSPPQPWTLADAFETYGIRNWGAGYFGINDKGNVDRPPGRAQRSLDCDLKELVDEVRRRGIAPAAADPLHRRAAQPGGAPQRGVPQGHRRARLQGRLPRRVPDQGEPAPLRGRRPSSRRASQYDYGLEAGSKPELLAVMALLDRPGRADHLQRLQGRGVRRDRALRLASSGRKVVLVVEKPTELPLIAEVARRTGIAPAHRHPREAVHARRRQVGGLGRRPQQVRPLVRAS